VETGRMIGAVSANGGPRTRPTGDIGPAVDTFEFDLNRRTLHHEPSEHLGDVKGRMPV
jgi:hypothetical protein